MRILCKDKYTTKNLEIIKYAFVMVCLDNGLGTFVVFDEHQDAFEIDKIYKMDIGRKNV